MWLRNVADELVKKTFEILKTYVLQKIKNLKHRDIWKKTVTRACEVTEGMPVDLAEYILSCCSVKRYFVLLKNRQENDYIYYNFIVTIAMEMSQIYENYSFSVSLAMAILDNWFEYNKIKTERMKEQLDFNQLAVLVANREKLYRAYFSLFHDRYANDTVRVYYPKNGENWIAWDDGCSIDIQVNLSKGTDRGLVKTGFAYSLIETNDNKKSLKVAFVDKEKEILRFKPVNIYSLEEDSILWVS